MCKPSSALWVFFKFGTFLELFDGGDGKIKFVILVYIGQSITLNQTIEMRSIKILDGDELK